MAWLQGLYIQHAVASVLGKRNKYPKKPFGEDKREATMEDIKARLQARNRQIRAVFEKE